MPRIVYRLWIDSHIIAEWHDPYQTPLLVQNALSAADNPNILHFGAFEITNDGSKPLFGVMGRKAIEAHLEKQDD